MLKNPKQHIQAIFKERTQGKRNAITLANALQKDIRTGFNGEHKFIFELLQNADDAVNYDQEHNNILFLLIDGLLIVSHAGKHFTEEDVEKICDYAQQQYKDKSADESKIGYKGVGFKAVFSIADCAYIISAGYSFKFDRFDACWQETFGNNPAPWPVTPIWCEPQDLPPPISALIKNLVGRVNFIFKLQNPEEVKQDLEFLSKNGRVLLFLKHINEIKIIINKQTINLSKIKENSGLICLKKDVQPISHWIIREIKVKIPEKMQSYLQTLDDYVCPVRLKQAKFTIFTYAARVSKGQLMEIDDSVVYCYLPTQLSLGLPFLINGDFLLNPERMHLQTNQWNDFVLELIAYFQIKWLSELAADTRYQPHVLKLLSRGRFSTTQHQIEQTYHRGIQSGLAKYPFVPSAADSSALLFVSSCYIDETGFYQQFEDHSIHDVIAKHDLQELDKLKTFGAKAINFDELLPRIETYLKNTPELELSIRILQFLVTRYAIDSIRYFNYNHSLKNYRFILSHAMVAEKPTDLCFKPKQMLDIPLELDVNFVHPTLLERVPQLKTWLQKLGISEPNYGELIKKYINQQLEKKDSLIKSDYEQLVNLLFMAFRKKYLSEKEISAFNNLKLVTKENYLKSPNQCFLSNEYRPEYKLEKHLSTLDIFVNPSYIINEDDTNAWREFFKLLGVRSNVSVRYYDQTITAQIAIEQWGDSVERYCDYLHVHDGQPKRNSPYRPTFLLYHFMAIDLLEYLSLPEIATLLMLAIVEEFEQVRNYAAKASYCGLHASISYLHYYFRFEAKLTSTIGNPLPAGKLLSPRFKKCLGAYLPVVDIEIELTSVQSEFFGFADQLSLEQCLIAFDVLGKKSLPDLAAYAIVIQSLLRLNLTSHDKDEIRLKNILLPTYNNTLSPANTLKFLTIEADNGLSSSEWLRPIPGLNREQLQEASTLLGVKVVESKRTKYQFTHPAEDSAFQKTIMNILPAIALIHAKRLAKEPKDIYQQLYQQIMSLKIYSVKQLELITEEGELIRICNAGIIDTMLLFKNRWDYLSTKQELFKVLCRYLQLDGDIPAIINDIISIELNSPEFNEWLIDLGFNQSDFKQLQKIKLIEVDTTIKQEAPSVKESTRKILLTLKQNKEADKHSHQAMENMTEKEQSDDDSTEMIYSDDVDVSLDKATIFSAANKISSTSSSVSPIIKRQQFEKFNPDKFRKSKVTIQPLQLPEFELYNPISLPGLGRVGKKVASLSQSQSTLIDDEFSSQIGAWGEQAVYYKLSEHYQTKYSEAVVKDTDNGFILSQKNFELKLIWHNKTGESYESVDFEIHKRINQEMKKRYVEVKSTRSNKPHKMTISHNEWQLMKEQRHNYRFFRVYNAGDYKNVSIATVKDPYGKLSNDELNLTSLEIKL